MGSVQPFGAKVQLPARAVRSNSTPSLETSRLPSHGFTTLTSQPTIDFTYDPPDRFLSTTDAVNISHLSGEIFHSTNSVIPLHWR